MYRPLITLALAGALLACRPADAPETTTGADITPAASARSGLDLDAFDFDIRPQDDLFSFVNGRWLLETEMPADRSDYGSFTQLADEAEARILDILDDIRAIPSPDANQRMIRDFHTALTDRDGANERGITPLAEELARIDAIDTHNELWPAFVHSLRLGAGAPLVGFVNQDAGDASRYALYLSQSGLTLPDRDYYLEDADRYVRMREMLHEYATGLLDLAGLEEAATRARDIVRIEFILAGAQWTRVQNRDPVATYNPWTIAELQAAMPATPWPAMLAALEISDLDGVIVRQPDYFQALDQIVTDVPLPAWRNWLRFRLINAYADWLADPFFDAHFAFHERGLRGVPEPRSLERRALDAVNRHAGMAVGQLYVERHFKPEARARMEVLVDNVKQAFRQSLQELDWMTDETRTEALAKLERFNTKIGYPDTWRDYEGLEIHADDGLGNLMRATAFEYRRNLARLGRPVDRDEWFMTPQTVNAYYSPRMNEIVFPAAILQPPFFDMDADDAVNYGGIGAVIGHELGHGFDDSGRRSDGDGNLRDWWTGADAAEYNRRADQLVAQYNRYNPIDNMYVDGRLTLGENIGDLGGMTIAWRAYQLSLNGDAAPKLDGFTGEQRFFLGWAQVWRRMYQDEELRRRMRTDTHSPARYRVNGVVVNMPAFHRAFGVQPGDALWLPPEERVTIW